MELTADLLKSLNNIRQNATIYVHAYHYTDDEKCVIVPRTSLPSAVTVRNNYSTASQWSRLYKAQRVCSGVWRKNCGNFHNTGG